jgi:hypothetical protein
VEVIIYMWSHVSIQCHVVWEDVLWSARAIWTDDTDAAPVVMQKSGRVHLGADDGPDAVLLAAVRDLQGKPLGPA